jgi:CRP-like cAMP-binding protein
VAAIGARRRRPFSEMATKPKNHLLASLSAAEWTRSRKHFEPFDLVRGQVLLEVGEPLSHLYFPEDGIVSMVATFETGAMAETATIGPEGVVSVRAVLGGENALNRKIVQISGSSYRIEVRAVERLQREIPAFRLELLAYAQVFLSQAMQLVACNGVHSLEERCARWLLMYHDRSEEDRFPLTQEFWAEMLGVSRPAVNRVARALQDAGLISYGRGMVEIEDRRGLKKMSCECYEIVRNHFDQLLPGSFKR